MPCKKERYSLFWSYKIDALTLYSFVKQCSSCPECQRFFFRGFRCRSCLYCDLPKRSEIYPSAAREKNLLYPGYVLFAGDTNLSSSVDCHTQYLNKKTRRVTTHGKQTLKSNHHEFSLFQGFTIIFIISIFTVKIS